MDNIKIKSIAFNMLDPDQRKLLEFAEQRTNFSAYGKRLIQRDMEGIHQPVIETPSSELLRDLI